MNKSEYAKLLLTDQWNEVRKAVLKRDHYCCKKCGIGNQRLSVHHKIYLEGKKPWEVPMQYLETLCNKCHEVAHKGRLIRDFIKKRIPTEHKAKVKKEKLRTLSQEENIYIAKLCMLERIYPTSKQWTVYKMKLYQGLALKDEDKAIINKWFNRAKNRAKKK